MNTVGAARLIFLWTSCLLLCSASLSASIISYQLEFNRTGRSVNYPNPRGGYLVVDLESGSVSSIVVLNDPETNEKYFTTGLFNGNYFTATSDSSGNVSDVISAGGGGGFESAALQISGRVRTNVDIGGDERVDAARKLVGFLLMSGSDAVVVESEEENPDASDELALGYVGSAKVTAEIAESDTQNFNNNDKSAADAIGTYAEIYENSGISSENGDTPNPGPNPSPEPSPSPEPEPTPDPLPTPTPDPFGF